MKLYLAARYSRREEILAYAEELRKLGFVVNGRWLTGKHGVDYDSIGPAQRQRFAQEDLSDIDNSEFVVVFTTPASTHGGMHVETGYAIAAKKKLLLVGERANVFHFLPGIDQVADFATAKDFLLGIQALRSGPRSR